MRNRIAHPTTWSAAPWVREDDRANARMRALERLNIRVATVFVPGFGFRARDGVRMRSSVVVEQNGRALKVMDCSTTALTTDLALEIRDDANQSACLSGAIDHNVLGRAAVTLTDENGVTYPQSDKGENGIGIGQHEFGFFSRRVSFERLPGDARRVVLAVRGGLGDWDVPIALAPITETGATSVAELDAEATTRDIAVRLTRAAFAADQTFIEVEARSLREGRVIAGIGDVQRQGDDRMVISDAAGHRYVEEAARETVRRPRGDGARAYAKFPTIAREARELTLVVQSVLVEEQEPMLEIALPLEERREMSFGRHRVQVGPVAIADDLLSPPGKPAERGVRLAFGPLASATEAALRPIAVGIDGEARKWNWGIGWHPEPGLRNLTISLGADAHPKSVKMEGALVRIAGPWEIRFVPAEA